MKKVSRRHRRMGTEGPMNGRFAVAIPHSSVAWRDKMFCLILLIDVKKRSRKNKKR